LVLKELQTNPGHGGSYAFSLALRNTRRPWLLMWESEMFRDITDVRRRVLTQPLAVKNRKPLHGWFAAAVFLVGAVASSGVTAANDEQICTHGGQNPQQGDSVACYSDAGCRFAAAAFGADPVRDYDPSSAPFALARGRITGIITSSSGLIAEIRRVGGSCRVLRPVDRSTASSPDQRFWRLEKDEGSCAVYVHRSTGEKRTFCDE
jgi:hypothetical protein